MMGIVHIISEQQRSVVASLLEVVELIVLVEHVVVLNVNEVECVLHIV